jgi:hypothetical protein
MRLSMMHSTIHLGKNRIKNRLGWVLAASLLGSGFGAAQLLYPSAGTAHEVKVSGEIGGTIHIEPNDTPKAGTANLAWFALTRRGGQPIALSDCNCTLAVYAQPRRDGDTPILQPRLSATSAEGRQGIPSASITFPRAGAYDVVLQGRPVNSGMFTPFSLNFSVTVAQ